MSPTLRLDHIHLRVARLDQSLDFYVQRLGFALLTQTANQATLGVTADSAATLTLTESRHAPAADPATAGLFHAALLFPHRAALGAWMRFSATRGVQFDGLSDHGVSEALYLSDPDGNGLEFYSDRPREAWPRRNGELAMSTLPLDWRELLAAAAASDLPPLTGATWGHLHLRVTNLERSEAFYREKLAVAVTQSSYAGARFLAADGYHHHLALNTWGRPQLPRPAEALGLVEAAFAKSGPPASLAIQDPDHISLRLEPW